MGCQRHAPDALSRERDSVPTIQEAVWAPGPVWPVAARLAPPGFEPHPFQPVARREDSNPALYKYTHTHAHTSTHANPHTHAYAQKI